jgi:ABC-type phosphate/phosphonate transport system substrate-binding protein
VLSALRRVAGGDARAVLLDGEQGAALQTLPFAAELEVVAKSPPLPPGILASVAGRMPAKALADLERALGALPQEPRGKSALEGVQTERFIPVDAAALERARRAYAAVPR